MKKYFFILILLLFSFIQKRELELYKFPKLFHFPLMPFEEENKVTVKGVELGRFLFYDKILSENHSFSCSSCHKQKNAFADNTKFSKGIYGEKLQRNTPPIFNLAWYESFFWDGRAKTIEEQILFPVSDHKEMDLDWKTASKRIKNSKFYNKKFKEVFGKQKIDSTLICKAIAQFERTLISNNSKYDKAIQQKIKFNEEEYRGFVVVNDQSMGDCLQCHLTDANALGTNGKFANNGLNKVLNIEDYRDKGKGGNSNNKNEIGSFKIPSLRNIELTAPYMHDGRFQTLEEVIDFYSEGVHNTINIDSKMQFAHKGGVHLSEKDKKAVIAFLKTLTDSTFINNKEFSNPFLY